MNSNKIQLYVENTSPALNESKIRNLFGAFGPVVGYEKGSESFCFVFMEDIGTAQAAVLGLNNRAVEGKILNVTILESLTTKIFVNGVRNVDESTLGKLFTDYGNILRADKVLNYAFVHMYAGEAANEAVRRLNNMDINGSTIRVQFNVRDGSGGASSVQKSVGVSSGGSKPNDGVKIFIGNVGVRDGVSEDSLMSLFKEYGTVNSIVLKPDYAFLFMADLESAKASIACLNGHQLFNRKMRVQLADDAVPISIKLFVGGLKNCNVSGDDLENEFNNYGKVNRVERFDDYAMVHMATKDDADSAIKGLNLTSVMGTTLKVDIAKNNKLPGKAKIFVGNLPHELTDKEELRSLFEDYGTVVDVILKRGYAFLYMSSSSECKSACNSLNGHEFSGRKMRVQAADPDSGLKTKEEYPAGNMMQRGRGPPANNMPQNQFSPYNRPRSPPRMGGMWGRCSAPAAEAPPLPTPSANSAADALMERYRLDYQRLQECSDPMEKARWKEYCMQDLDLIRKYEDLQRTAGDIPTPSSVGAGLAHLSGNMSNFGPQRGGRPTWN